MAETAPQAKFGKSVQAHSNVTVNPMLMGDIPERIIFMTYALQPNIGQENYTAFRGFF